MIVLRRVDNAPIVVFVEVRVKGNLLLCKDRSGNSDGDMKERTLTATGVTVGVRVQVTTLSVDMAYGHF
jgi:hypothetical protein